MKATASEIICKREIKVCQTGADVVMCVFIHNMICTPDVSYSNHKKCNISYTSFVKFGIQYYSVLVSVSCPKALFHLESDNLFRITVVVADWLG